MSIPLHTGRLASPLGPLRLTWIENGPLVGLDFAENTGRWHRLLRRRFGSVPVEEAAVPAAFAGPLADYFAGVPNAPDRIPVDPGGTPFQRRVWAALRRIPPGTTASYGLMAEALGAPGAGRAVGRANALNPVCIVVPCHRLIGTSGRLTGYVGGLERKRWLLAHEGADGLRTTLPRSRSAAGR